MRSLLLSLAVHALFFAVCFGMLRARPMLSAEFLPQQGTVDIQWQESRHETRSESSPQKTIVRTQGIPVETQPPSESGAKGAIALTPSNPHPGSLSTGDPYYAKLRARIQSKVRYPAELARRRIEGNVVLKLTIGADGSLQASQIGQSSGHSELDRLALESARSAAPFDPPSDKSQISLTLPIDFHLR